MRKARFLLLAEGNPETGDSWSGISRSIVHSLRAQGHTVSVGDTELTGLPRMLVAGATFAPTRSSWRARYRLGKLGYALRSRRARRYVAQHARDIDFVLQIGATFDTVGVAPTIPRVIVCDANVQMACDASAAPYTEAGALSAEGLSGVRRRELAVYQHASAILTLSERARRSFVDSFDIPPERVTTIYAGPNFDIRSRPTGSPDPGAPKILFVGRQFHRKGGDVLVRAFRQVREQVPTAELVVIGPEQSGDPEPGVRWIGYLSNDRPDHRAMLVEAYRSASVFCLPTRYEPLGIAFIEAMHLGLPCVGTSVWAVSEMIVEAETGYVVPVDDAEQLAERLIRLLQDQRLARRMGAAGQARAAALFTWQAAVTRILCALESLVSG